MEMTVAAVLVASLVGFGTAVMLATAVVVVTDLEGVTVAEVLADTFLLSCVGTVVAQDYSVVGRPVGFTKKFLIVVCFAVLDSILSLSSWLSTCARACNISRGAL